MPNSSPFPAARDSVGGAILGNPRTAVALSVALVGAIALADYATGYEVRLAVLYLLPVFLAAWAAGWVSGTLIALFATLSWLVIFRSGHPYSNAIYYYWEGAILFGTLLVFVLILVRLRRALANADERFVTVLEGLDAAVYASDVESGTMLYTNRRFEEFFGPSPKATDVRELESSFDVVPKDYFYFANSSATPREARPLTGEFHDRKTGRCFLVHARSIGWVNGRSVSLKVVTDVTEAKKAQEANRLQMERLQMSAKLLAIGEMASALSHELNQPLTAIASYNQGCVRLLRSGNPDMGEVLSFMEKCSVQAVRAGNIINRMREFVRKREPVRNSHDLNAIIRAAVKLVEMEAARSGVGLTLHLAPALPSILTDAIMIEQVLLNLISNGIEAMQQVKPESRRLTIASAHTADAMLLVSLCDCGPGMPPEVAANLYTPFFTTKESGMGIGLNISRSIIEFHGGKLWHEPGIDCGSVFYFTLPVQSA